MRSFQFIFAGLLFLASFQVHADSNDKLKTFLISCGYGTAAGALLGVGSLAFASNPSGSLNNIAEGASLGLYVGIGVGLYMTADSPPAKQDVGSAYVTPSWYQGKVDGAELHVITAQF